MKGQPFFLSFMLLIICSSIAIYALPNSDRFIILVFIFGGGYYYYTHYHQSNQSLLPQNQYQNQYQNHNINKLSFEIEGVKEINLTVWQECQELLQNMDISLSLKDNMDIVEYVHQFKQLLNELVHLHSPSVIDTDKITNLLSSLAPQNAL